MPDPNNMQLAPAAAAAIEKKMHDGVLLAEQFVNRNYLIHIAKQPLVPPNPAAQSFSYDSLFEITGLVYDPGEGINDKLVSVYSALYSLGSILLGIPVYSIWSRASKKS